MLHLVDVSRYQVERSNPLDLAKAKQAGYAIANVALTGGRGYVSGSWAKTYLDRAAALGMGRSTYHWLDGTTSGGSQARVQIARLRSMLGNGLGGFAHVVDIEETGKHGITPPKWQHVYDYVHAMQDALGRRIAVYSGDWFWQPKGWPGSSLTPYLMGPPNDGYLAAAVPADSPHWRAAWGGWPEFAILQWGVRPLPGTGDCSLSVIRDHGVWADLTGGDVLMPQVDPGNAQPDTWIGPPVGGSVAEELRAIARSGALPIEPDAEPGPKRDLAIIPRGATAEVCAPTINAEMADWKALGGSSLGCVGDERHGTGYHRGANYVPASDYSRRRDPNGADGPYVNWNYACAGDFRHGGNAALRNLGRIVLAELMAGRFPQVGEFIGQPWADRPVMYWSRWEGVLREYTGSGHDLWFHVSYFRSRVNSNPHIWQNAVRIRDEDTMNSAQQKLMTDGFANVLAAVTDVPAAVWAHKLRNPYSNVDQEAGTILRYVPSRNPHEITHASLARVETALGLEAAEIPPTAEQNAAAVLEALGASAATPEESAAQIRAALTPVLGDRAPEVFRLLAGEQ